MRGPDDPLPVIVGVDPGSPCGWCVLLPGKTQYRYYLWRFGQMKPTRTKVVRRVLEEALEKANGEGIKLVVEGQYIVPTRVIQEGKLGPKQVIALVMNRARWQVIAEDLEIEAVPVSPLRWQGHMLGATKAMKSRDRKKAAVRFVKGFFGIEKVTDHEADAICMAANEARYLLAPVVPTPRPDQGERAW